jgi:hypothetical protein
MKLTASHLRRIIKEEVSRMLMEAEEIQAPSAWAVRKGPIPGINPGHEVGAVLIVSSVEDGMARYGIFFPETKITIKDKTYDNAYDAARSVGAQVMLDNGHSGMRGERLVIPVEDLMDKASKLGR